MYPVCAVAGVIPHQGYAAGIQVYCSTGSGISKDKPGSIDLSTAVLIVGT